MDDFRHGQKSKFRIADCGGVKGGECYLIKTDGTNLLVDSGFGFCAKKTAENIRNELGSETLDCILLTHSHYDHAMGSAYLKKAFPGCTVAGSEYCAYILGKESARKAMADMDKRAARQYGFDAEENISEPLGVDLILKDGECFSFGKAEIQAVSLPGHTKCCMGYYLKKEKVLISCETLGIYVGGLSVCPGCMVGYSITLDSFDKALSLDADELLIPHSGMLYGKEISGYLKKAKEVTTACRDLIVSAHKSGACFEELVALFKEKYYTADVAEYYPEHALMANLKAQIPMFIESE